MVVEGCVWVKFGIVLIVYGYMWLVGNYWVVGLVLEIKGLNILGGLDIDWGFWNREKWCLN